MNTVVSQALASGLPVITTKHSGLPDQVIDGKNGFLVDEGDYEGLAEKMLYYIDHQELWGGFSEFGRQHVKNNYDSFELIERQVGFYEAVMNDDL